MKTAAMVRIRFILAPPSRTVLGQTVIPGEYADPLQHRLEQNHRHHHDQNPSHKRVQPVVEDQPGVPACRRQLSRMRQKTNSGIGVEHLVQRRGERHRNQPNQWQQRYACVTRFMHLESNPTQPQSERWSRELRDTNWFAQSASTRAPAHPES